MMEQHELEQYAADLILEAAKEIEFLTVFEGTDGREGFENFSEEDAGQVWDLINGATITVLINEQEWSSYGGL